MSDVPIPRREAVRDLVRAHPGRRAVELERLCGSVVLRSWMPRALRVLRESAAVRVDEHGAYWPTG
ncbi:hypothetical protein [Streptomyces sp. NPDC058739]|uniref:hypothetical protein n=1 Tax=Streptomyces sp. NPDC058739 TaxID=3346618 RepID=UPI0036854C7F